MNRKLYCVGFTILPLLALHAQRYDPSTFPLPNHFLPLHTGQQMVVRIPVSLGSLGDAVIESERNTTGHVVCGATGNCPTSLCFRWHRRQHRIDLGSGWAYAIVRTQRHFPDIVIMANLSAESGQATRFGFIDGAYVETGSDYVELKEGKANSLASDAWVVRP